MEIKYIGQNRIRCALTEEEIRGLGFDIDEIIGNSDTTQQFMRAILGLVEEQEHIQMGKFSPVVKAELLQDHSMAITFGEDADGSFKSLVDTVSHIMSEVQPERMKALAQEQKQKKTPAGKRGAEPMVCALRFTSLEHVRRMSHVCFPGKVPKSSLYKVKEWYYLVLDFAGFTKEEMRPFAFGTVEYDEGHYSDTAQIAHIMEQGECIVKKEAIEMLIQL